MVECNNCPLLESCGIRIYSDAHTDTSGEKPSHEMCENYTCPKGFRAAIDSLLLFQMNILPSFPIKVGSEEVEVVPFGTDKKVCLSDNLIVKRCIRAHQGDITMDSIQLYTFSTVRWKYEPTTSIINAQDHQRLFTLICNRSANKLATLIGSDVAKTQILQAYPNLDEYISIMIEG
jgi:hypothetical protein